MHHDGRPRTAIRSGLGIIATTRLAILRVLAPLYRATLGWTSWGSSLATWILARGFIRSIELEVVNATHFRELAEPQTHYERFRAARLAARRTDGPWRQEPGLLSFLTPVWNTPPQFLEGLSASVFRQDGGTDFEWFILDNGSTKAATREALTHIGTHPCVRLERVPDNLGIIGAMRYCLERATARYVLPLDSDDVLAPDCVHVVTRALARASYPPLAYTDEDKVEDGRFMEAFFKPDWDPVLFVNACYIAHLCAIDRVRALSLGLYSDTSAEGCHDWDSFTRFLLAGHQPLHIPEVLYSWRMHRSSTARDIEAKPYVYESHRNLLNRFIASRPGPDRFTVVPNVLFRHGLQLRLRRERVAPADISTVKLHSGFNMEALARAVQAAQPDHHLIRFLWEGIEPDGNEWSWEAIGQFELFDDVAVVGGALHDGSRIIAGPIVFGFGGGIDSPDRGRLRRDPGYFGLMWRPHSVAAMSSGHMVVKREFLLQCLPELRREDVPTAILGPWLGGLAREAGKRTVFTPFMNARADQSPQDEVTAAALARFSARFAALIPEVELYSPRLGLSTETAYRPVADIERAQ